MVHYDVKILNSLLDSYENSRLFTGENKVAITIDFPFNKKKIPAYFDESSYEYERIHNEMFELEEQGYIHIVWKRGKENHIISKVVLNLEQLDDAYRYVKRTPKAELVTVNIAMLEECRRIYETPICGNFIAYLLERLYAHQTVKEYINLEDLEKTKQILKGIFAIERNQRQCYLREFSIEVFHDSKILEGISGKLGKIFLRFGEKFKENGIDESDVSERDFAEILAEYGIYHTPNYVHLKGDISLSIYGTVYHIGDLKQGIGISGEDLPACTFDDMSAIKRVITIENLTTFFRWKEPESLIVYLGGYHNSVRRSLLKTIHETLPDAKYYHFGDIDAGGFEIYSDLCRKTGIPFEMYRMDLDTLKTYQKYGKELTGNDRKRLERVLESDAGKEEAFDELIRYMLANNVKLEQECVML